MRVEHMAIDGSIVSIEADADLSTQSTASGWAIVPSLMRAHPFVAYPPGHSDRVEKMVRENIPDVTVRWTEDYSLKGGRLRVAEVTLPTATNGKRNITVGAWEGRRGCLTTSLTGSERDRVVEIFDTLKFSERAGGIGIDSPVTPRPREPEVLKEIPRLGVLNIRPAIASTLERVPRTKGRVTNHGELFRFRQSSNAMLFVSPSAVVRIDPLQKAQPTEIARPRKLTPKESAEFRTSAQQTGSEEIDTRELSAIAQSLRIEWVPRESR
ncbi:MAG TPA: hypothetical protein VFT02_06595 [Pyrinomonadaceae bacterium]|nr:hypothetical protein [Pyrinomonadaceae bacterium]